MVSSDTMEHTSAWKRIGFLQYSPEYWLLGEAIVSRLSSAVSVLPLSHTAVPDATAPGPVLGDYDQTSMRQVNDLIAEFQNVRL
jgi:hypothetical protein